MDPLQLLDDLEGLRDKIPSAFQNDFEELINTIRHIYTMSIKFVTPPHPVQDGEKNLSSHHTTISDLHKQLNNSLSSFQLIYVGEASNTYHATANTSVQNLQLIADHLSTASSQHNTMATNLEQATEAKIALAALLVGLGITLGVLIFSAGTTAPVTVPAAALEAAGGTVSIGLLTEAEAAAAFALLSLAGPTLTDALLLGSLAALGTEIAFHTPTPTITLPHPITNFPQITVLNAHSHVGDLPISGKATGPNVYYPPKNMTPDQAWDKVQQGYKDAQGRVWKWDTKHKDHWDVQLKDGSHINVFPDGVERGQREKGNDGKDNKGKDSGKKGKK
ncbi:WXG100 family type VII secretion target [Tengunoibacter tsumagoiensis]|uniref:Uncharacterized protein n=1 Tax=Tengunoibacter tsumagoiensis TaxID=2014871 RepID=A0A402A0E0_9CHLR|nr:WXG100 family type VII secretion target [Tengunoibacter tsumagoiensis]GCE12529.1 hypothetical protein KTT_23880 [Tengunoibacter tsumagoiensis]